MFFDAHLHKKGSESGGFYIGLEGTPFFEGVFNNEQALSYHSPEKNCISFLYIRKEDLYNNIDFKFLKYHPRRENYTVDEVIKSIELLEPRCVIIDTLNEPYWRSYDYWNVAIKFPDVIFIFAHSGGYLINDFLKICHFQRNVYIDFALTHTVLGKYGDKKKGLFYIHSGIKYALNSVFRDRILLSSDTPFFSQNEVIKYYKKMKVIKLLNKNFISLMEKLK